ncbi:MAG: hypothetical protein AAF845_17905 [Bacteroidota bacterium]
MAVRFPGAPRARAHGRAVGLAADGALRVDTGAGEVAVYAGEATLSPALP